MYVVYSQFQRWLKAGVFGAMSHDLRVFLRWAEEGDEHPTAATGESVQIAYIAQGDTGVNAAPAAARHGIELVVVK